MIDIRYIDPQWYDKNLKNFLENLNSYENKI